MNASTTIQMQISPASAELEVDSPEMAVALVSDAVSVACMTALAEHEGQLGYASLIAKTQNDSFEITDETMSQHAESYHETYANKLGGHIMTAAEIGLTKALGNLVLMEAFENDDVPLVPINQTRHIDLDWTGRFRIEATFKVTPNPDFWAELSEKLEGSE